MTEAAQPYPPTPTAAAHPRRWRRLHKTIGRGSCSPPPPTGCKDACFVYTIFGKLPRLAHPIPPPPLSNNPPSSRRTFELPRSAARPLRYHAPPPPRNLNPSLRFDRHLTCISLFPNWTLGRLDRKAKLPLRGKSFASHATGWTPESAVLSRHSGRVRTPLHGQTVQEPSLLASPPLTTCSQGVRVSPLRKLSAAVVFSPPSSDKTVQALLLYVLDIDDESSRPGRQSSARTRVTLLSFRLPPSSPTFRNCENPLVLHPDGARVESQICEQPRCLGGRHSHCQVLLRESVEASGQATYKKLLGANTLVHQCPRTLA